MIKLHGKYLKVVEDFAGVLSHENWHRCPGTPEYGALVRAVETLHGEFLSTENARTIVYVEVAIFFTAERNQGKVLALDASARSELVLSLKNYIESLPLEYAFSIQLPAFTWLGAYDIPVTEKIRLVSVEDASGAGNQRLNALAPKPSGESVLSITVHGFGSHSPDSPATADAISIAKQCAFLLDAYGICRSRYFEGRATASLITQVDQSLQFVNLPDSLVRCFGSLALNEETLNVYDPDVGKTVLNSFRTAETDEEKIEGLRSSIANLSRFFKLAAHPDFPRIAAAIEWYQDSIFADNQTFAFLAACIGLEALIGSEGQMDQMSMRLADRYAYLMGKGWSDRERLSNEFRQILNVRGKLVHARQARLSAEHQTAFRTAQSMLLEASRKELNEMYRST
jgi:hypothetical protein